MAATKKTTTKAAAKAQPKAALPKVGRDTYLVVIPWRKAPMDGREIEYAVAGWQRHFKEKHIIIVVGEDDPKINGVTWIESKRVPGKEGQYRQHLDYVSCFRKVHAAFPESRGFIFVADDVYAVNDFDLIDVMQIKNNGDTIEARIDDQNTWKQDKAKGKAVLLAERYPIVNYTTHLPQWYDWDKLEALWNKYDMDSESYLMEDLYFNIYYPRHRTECIAQINQNKIKCGVYRKDLNQAREGNIKTGMQYLQEAADGSKIWIVNSPDGWSDQLDNFLANYYDL